MTGSASPLDGFAEAAGRILAQARRDWQAERELAKAETRQTIAELRAEVAGLKLALHEMAAERLATLRDGKDGEPGPPGKSVERAEVEALVGEKVAVAVAALPPPVPSKDADPQLIAEMVAAEVAKLPPAEPGKSVDPEEVRALVSAEVEQAVKSLPLPVDGHTPTEAELSPLIKNAVSAAILALPKPKDGEDGKSVDPADIERMVYEAVQCLPPPEKGDKGEPGESIRGERGPPGLDGRDGRDALSGSNMTDGEFALKVERLLGFPVQIGENRASE